MSPRLPQRGERYRRLRAHRPPRGNQVERSSVRGPHHALTSGRDGQCTVCRQVAPGKNLTTAYDVLAGDERYTHLGQTRRLDDPDLFFHSPSRRQTRFRGRFPGNHGPVAFQSLGNATPATKLW